MTDFTIILRSLRLRLFSTCVTVLMVAVAVALLLVLLSMRESSRQAFNRGTGDMHLLISRDASPLVAVLNGIFYANPPRNPITWEKFQQIRQRYGPGNQPSRRIEAGYVIPVQQGDSYRGHPTLATTVDFFTRLQPNPGQSWQFTAGEGFDQPFEIVLGAEVAEATNLNVGDAIFLTHGRNPSRIAQDQNGDQLAPHQHREFSFEIVGVLAPTGGPHDRALFLDLTSTWIIHAFDRRRAAGESIAPDAMSPDMLTPADRLITGIYLRLPTRRGAQLSGAQQQVFDELRRDTSITVANPQQEISQLFAIVSNVDELFLAMAVVVMFSSAIAVMLALYNSMDQRRRQIAVLRVLGCSRPRIFGLIVTESAIIGILGVVAGIVMAWVGTVIVAAELKARLGLVIDPMLPFESTFLVAIATIVLASLAGVLPAALGYRTSVIRNLRPLG